ncbi:XrtA-associated tyrosine autokinase [Plasticicumulans sp.]|uniref:XrtA-associated tyrosine autokinase n=1 Tax=Plasticicumulans sp. TaxID=2307179 RepID=UPI002CB9D9ED|nr:XrtA-associated tyrosine autokinase [Plasticicumulans sp.]MBS0600335.1 tyrosine-protein kinase family protein [Pseudomonadota bacterium]HMV37927.1 XrtA-associated tyrosine autokinase [Plasticicumulans sp.]HMW29885.1 XrtA-associated tyrosine autokinase [Plasticicumulans sp.]HMW41367.1 XrtA-associated tyrosine autokinase [Plasticicumulans sp.]HMX52471.1 XrtA-associated tyrosine autokinase [Plasticicumulans sp.]
MDTIEKAIERLSRHERQPAPVAEAQGTAAIVIEPAPLPAVPGSQPVRAETPAAPAVVRRTKRSVTLDLQRIRDAGMVVPDGNRSRIKEEYRHIKRPLLLNAAGKGAAVRPNQNVMMVSSSQPGEGKTFTSINLALSIAAERDRTVLLVDADVLKPTVSRFFGVDNGPGLVDFLVDGQLDLSEVLVETNVPSLVLLPAGNSHHLSTELLGSTAMRDLMTEMSNRYSDRVIIMDSPPLLATTEAAVLAHLVGQIIMVVEAERTRQSLVKEALALLDPDMAVGFVLNKSRQAARGDYYGPYYYSYAEPARE